MKKLAILVAILFIQTQVFAAQPGTNVNYNKKPAQRTQQQTQQVNKQQQVQPQTKPASDNTYNADYLLKYNIDDLEAAPWLNGGNRKI